ncbi:MAG: ABC transporter ATP-binding protein [Legionella sp.]|nr:MAG: ABC transporter ATP-binding protein [Legionella sp.]
MATETIIDVKGLKKSFDQRVVVNNIDLQVKKGDIFGFLGPNGSGKTTTIRMLCGLLKADAGSGTCLGYNILTETEKIKEQVGYMIQKFSLYQDLSVQENLDFIARVYNIKDRKAKVAQALANLGLTERKNQLTGKLSGGWKQRVALASCLIHDPKLLLLDEPTAGVDPIARREFWDHIHSLSEQGITALVSTHYMDEAERCTHIAYIAHGEILVRGSVEQVIATTRLRTWEITTQVSTSLLQKIKQLDGVELAAMFGNIIHVCGYDVALVESELRALSAQTFFEWSPTQTTLEDAFISLVNQSPEPIIE